VFARSGRLAGRYTPRGRLAALQQRLLLAGAPRQWTLERILVFKALLALTAAALGLLRMLVDPSGLALLLTILLTVGGFFVPDLLLARRAEKRQQVIRRALADTFDQLAITVRAGLGLEAAIARVARTSDGPLSLELANVVQDTRAGMSRADALTALAERVQLPELRQVVVALVQAEKLGVPVSQTLQVQAAELRIKRRQHAEEQAMKLPVKIIFPMVFCILPCLFIVVLGPAAMNIYDSLVKG
jgi:tight adherence protein C